MNFSDHTLNFEFTQPLNESNGTNTKRNKHKSDQYFRSYLATNVKNWYKLIFNRFILMIWTSVYGGTGWFKFDILVNQIDDSYMKQEVDGNSVWLDQEVFITADFRHNFRWQVPAATPSNAPPDSPRQCFLTKEII